MACHSHLCTSLRFALPFARACAHFSSARNVFSTLHGQLLFVSQQPCHCGEAFLTLSLRQRLHHITLLISFIDFCHSLKLFYGVFTAVSLFTRCEFLELGTVCWSLLHLQCLEHSRCCVNFCWDNRISPSKLKEIFRSRLTHFYGAPPIPKRSQLWEIACD